MGIWNKLKSQDLIITTVLVLLSALSLILVFSTTFNASNPQEGQGTITKQIIFIIIGFIFYMAIMTIDLSWIKQKPIAIGFYVLILMFLIYLLFFGTDIENTKRWILLGPLSFQPAEFAKIALVIITSFIFTHDVFELPFRSSHYKEETSRPADSYIVRFIVSAILTFLYAFLIRLQPSLGNALIISFIWVIQVSIVMPLKIRDLAIILLGGLATLSYFRFAIFSDIFEYSYLSPVVWKLFTIIALILILLTLVFVFGANKFLAIAVLVFTITIAPISDFAWNNLLQDYHKDRIEVYLGGADSQPQGGGYQVRQSVIAIGSGQLTGRGFLKGTQSSLKVLPFAHTDFIFASLAEQFGFIGVVTLFGLYLILLSRFIIIYYKTNDQFGKLIVIGATAIIFINIFINTAMNMGLIPVTGVPLPLVSYGGSSVMVTLISISLVQAVNNSVKAKDLSNKFSFK